MLDSLCMLRRRKPLFAPTQPLSDVRKRRAFQRRIEILHGVLLFCLLIIIARLIELQIIRGSEYEELARAQHFGGIELPAKRGEIFSRNSKSGEMNLLATNTTLDLLYVDPFVTPDKRVVANLLALTLLTKEADAICRAGDEECPREFRGYYAIAFDPLQKIAIPFSQPLPAGMPEAVPSSLPTVALHEDLVQAFSRDIERRISGEFVSFVPLLYGATKVQLQKIQEFGIPGIAA